MQAVDRLVRDLDERDIVAPLLVHGDVGGESRTFGSGVQRHETRSGSSDGLRTGGVPPGWKLKLQR